MAHEETPQGPSHIAPIAAQPSNAMAIGPSRTHMAKMHNTMARRELMA
jgi:hypothetical protein